MNEKTETTKTPSVMQEVQTEITEIEERYKVLTGRIRAFDTDDKKLQELKNLCEVRIGKFALDHMMIIICISMLEAEQQKKTD